MAPFQPCLSEFKRPAQDLCLHKGLVRMDFKQRSGNTTMLTVHADEPQFLFCLKSKPLVGHSFKR